MLCAQLAWLHRLQIHHTVMTLCSPLRMHNIEHHWAVMITLKIPKTQFYSQVNTSPLSLLLQTPHPNGPLNTLAVVGLFTLTVTCACASYFGVC